MNTGLTIIAVALAAARIAGANSAAFQAISHLFVGGLLASAVTEYRFTWIEGGKGAMHKAYLAGGLSIVEVVCFIITLCGYERT